MIFNCPPESQWRAELGKCTVPPSATRNLFAFCAEQVPGTAIISKPGSTLPKGRLVYRLMGEMQSYPKRFFHEVDHGLGFVQMLSGNR